MRDLFVPRALVYWVDFGIAYLTGAAAFVLAPRFDWHWEVLLYLVSVVALYRAAVFIHEVVHLRRGSLKRFRIVWNVACGVPLLIPSFLYQNHFDHHAKRHYGMSSDGEYVPFAQRAPSRLVAFLLASPFVPLFALVRFLVLTPLAWANTGMRKFVDERASALQIDIEFVWRQPSKEERRWWTLQEAACFVFLVALGVLVAAGLISPLRVLQGYLTLTGIVLLNSLRLLGAHRYRGNEEEMTFVEQMLDSINYPYGRFLPELWAPVGLRWHALHHLFPGMPYHELGAAHNRLMAELPDDSPYRRTESTGLLASLTELWRAAAASQSQRRGRVPKRPEEATDVAASKAARPLPRVLGAGPVRGARALRADPLGFFLRVARECPEIGSFRVGPQRLVLINTPELVQELFVERVDCFDKGSYQRRALRPLLRDGLLISDGAFHAHQRKLIAPALAPVHMARFADTMVAATDRQQRQWADGAEFDLLAEMVRLTMSNVGNVLLGEEIGGHDELAAAVTTAFEWEMYAFTRLLPIPLGVPTPRSIRTRRALKLLRSRIGALIRERSADGTGDDLLSLLVAARDEAGDGMSPQQLFDEALTLAGAAYETSADALAWTFYALDRHPEVRDRLYDETDSVLGDRLPTYDDLARLPYAAQVFKESLRMYPPAVAIIRSAVRPTQLGGFRISKGDVVLVSPYALHRREEVFPDPEQFDPERFSPENAPNLPRHAFLPFGAGRRVCLGAHFSMVEGQLVTATIARRVIFECTRSEPIKPELVVNLRPKGGIPVRVRRRGGVSAPV